MSQPTLAHRQTYLVCMPGRKHIIEHIIRNNPNLKKEVLLQLSVESLQVIRFQTELEILNKRAQKG